MNPGNILRRTALGLILMLIGCAHDKPDLFSGYYVGTDKVMKITKSKSGPYQVLIKAGSGRELSMDAVMAHGRLASEYGGGYLISRDSGAVYSMGGVDSREPIRKTDSLHYVERWDSLKASTTPPP